MAKFVPAPNRLRVYTAEDIAAREVPATPLDGTVIAAQEFSDKITSSIWWQRNCPASWRGDRTRDPLFYAHPVPPSRILVLECRTGGAFAITEELRKAPRGNWYPWTEFGPHTVHNGVKPIADPWVILHELAHHMSAPLESYQHHGPEFIKYSLLLVRKYLSLDHYRALRRAYREVGLRLPGDLE